jgi:hypothetical protein
VRPSDDAIWAHVIREHETGEPALLDDEGVAVVNKALSVYGSRTFLDRTWIRPGPTWAALASPELAPSVFVDWIANIERQASATPPSTEGLAEAWNDHSYSHSGGCTAAGCLADILARLRSTQDET